MAKRYKLISFLAVSALAALIITACVAWPKPSGQIEIHARFEKSLRGTLDGAPILVLRGTHYERGLAHGYLAAEEMLDLLDGYIAPHMVRIAKNKGINYDFLANIVVQRFEWPERFEQELKGILDGISKALPTPAEREIKTLGRPITLADLKLANCASDLMRIGCSSFVAWSDLTEDGQVVAGRNLDYFNVNAPLRKAQCIMAIVPEETDCKPTVGISWTGAVGVYTAMNTDGVFIAIHDVRATQQLGLQHRPIPRSIALRAAIEASKPATAISDIEATLKAYHSRVGSNILVCGPRVNGDKVPQTAVIEWDSGKAQTNLTVRKPGQSDSSIICTNHYLLRRKEPSSGWSATRFQRLIRHCKQAANGNGSKIAGSIGQKMLDDVSQKGTVHSVLAWPEQKRLAAALLPEASTSATKGKWISFDINEILSLSDN